MNTLAPLIIVSGVIAVAVLFLLVKFTPPIAEVPLIPVPNPEVISLASEPPKTSVTPPKILREETPAEWSAYDQTLFHGINQARFNRGLNDLKANVVLTRVAKKRVEDMVARNYFSHVDPDGVKYSATFEAEGYNYLAAAEDLARGFSDPTVAFDAFMASPTHKEKILDTPLADIGIYSLQQTDGTFITAVEFGQPQS